jgi:hypothetical protein
LYGGRTLVPFYCGRVIQQAGHLGRALCGPCENCVDTMSRGGSTCLFWCEQL